MAIRIKDIMVAEVVTIEPKISVREAVRLMNDREIGCLVVVDHEKPIGIITERDMLKRVLVATRDPKEVRVEEIMSKPLVFMKPEGRIEAAAKLMFKQKIKKLPIIEDGRLVGLVTLTDLTRTPQVYKCLEELRSKETPRRIRKVIDVHVDPTGRLGRKCPLITVGGYPIKCQEQKCMWWLKDECSVLKLTRKLCAPVESLKVR